MSGAQAEEVVKSAVPIADLSAIDAVLKGEGGALRAAVQPWRAQVRLIDAARVFTPTGYRDAMPVDGRRTLVRQADGIHLNSAGAGVLADVVIEQVARDFSY